MTTHYLQASFRGVPFLVETSDDEGGGRNIIHEFPGRDEAYAEPSGRYTRKFTLEAHLVRWNADGEWFEATLKRLETALNEPGPGTLLHPQRGDLVVALDGPYHIKRSTKELGMVRVSLPFVEAGTNLAPRVLPDASADAREKAYKAKLAGRTPPLSVKGPDFLQAAATAILKGPGGLVAQLSKVNNRINAAFGIIDLVSRQITAFSNEVTTLLLTPAVLALKLQGLLNAVVSSAAAAGVDLNRGDKQRNTARVSSVLGFLTAVGTFGDTQAPVPVINETPTRAQQVANQDALTDLVEAGAVVETVTALVDIPLDSADQASELLETVDAIFDRIAERGTVDDAQGQALRDLRAAFYAYLRSETESLKALGRYTPPVTVPALALAYQLYGDSSLAEEIAERNGVEHPGFLPGGVELVVANV